VDPDGTIKLLSAILAGTPRLDGAACVSHHQLYDETPRSGAARSAAGARRGRSDRVPGVPGYGHGARVAGLIDRFRDLGKRRYRLQGKRRLRPVFLIDGSGQSDTLS
jgi:hypothetical protein